MRRQERRMRMRMMMVAWILGLGVSGAGSNSNSRDISSRMDWLTRYGYLPPPDPYSARQQTLDGLREAVRTMQRFAGLRESGILDEDTIAMMNKPRCSLPDIILAPGYQGQRRKRYAPSGSVWQKRHLTWRVESVPISLTYETTKDLIGSALQAWSRESLLDFSQSAADDADIRVSFVEGSHGDGYPFDGPGGTLGHAFFPGVGDSAGATHMDADETWTYNAADGTDLFAVAVHEFGHSLGLSHSSAENSIMKPYYQGPVGEHWRYRLPPDDVEGIQALYGKRMVHPGAEEPPPPAPTQRYIPPREPTYRPRLPFPDRCSTHFDAVANIRGEVFFFKGRYFWRVQATRQLVSLNPAHLGRFWMGLPPDLPKVDAVYERANDSKIVFIAGTSFWVFKDNLVESGYPRAITDFGLNTDGVDGAFVWKHNKKTYFFRHNRYWRFDERQGKMDPGYPKDSNLWQGPPSGVDDVISWTDGHTYFFKGAHYWKFRDGNVEAEAGYPRDIAMNWMYCAAAAPPPPEPTEPEGRDQRGCNCPCAAGSALVPAPTRLCLTAALTLMLLCSTQ
ncbi:matrix metalloproteinase-25 [Dendropsophus ebraccatus]|uniref:matrix metalloproteinase-25 n=1 Tax=Dendropsophus ebraccatus TaxID=150705 RepID=UPI0038312AFB